MFGRVATWGRQGISSLGGCTRRWLSGGGGSLTEVSTAGVPGHSPLQKIPTPGQSVGSETADRRREAIAVLSKIPQSIEKVNLVAAFVRGMRVDDALMQCVVSTKRAAKDVAKARSVLVFCVFTEAYVGKDKYLRRINVHGKGKSGVKHRPRTKLTVKVRELSPKEEATLARSRLAQPRQETRAARFIRNRLQPARIVEVDPSGRERTADAAKPRRPAAPAREEEKPEKRHRLLRPFFL
ncbi:hypothetical protein CBR_g23715 [Chara braunii]|uniref:50S ribosomal protein L22, chloroplastic n=1 Tax=Chara braunii TaxID=69332 RepID=A0A388L504_CHABU|nr:hypothetical protein CBR_g23715 [Chara braunii]|eukprot:GBG77384.1 hypothetical protein CBR_g23715 [Chara braunii]